MTDHANRAHALLSASSADRWLSCTPSAKLEETLPESTSSYADEGRFAHEVAELKLRKHVTVMKLSEFNAAMKKLKADPLFNEEMVRHAQTYVDYISKIVHNMKEKPHIVIEKKVDYSNYAPSGFGTADCIIIGDDTIHVVDFKYGQGVPVSAEDNAQMKLYALGALNAYSMLFPISQIQMTIVQPRLDSVSECRLVLEDLLEWGENDVKPLAELAHKGEGEFVPGDHCRFCRAKAICRARSDNHTALEDFGMATPPLLSDAEVGEILARGKNLAKWLKDLEDYALGRCLAGGEIPGWKAVPGRSSRTWTDGDAALEKIKAAGWDEALLYTRSPLSLAQIEKLIGKPKFGELVSDFVETPPGKPTLVEASDKRNPVTPIDAKSDFGTGEDF